MTDDNDAPARIWLEPACVPYGERCWAEHNPGDCGEEGCEMPAIEYVRADLVPQPQEPTPEAVERAARVLALEDAREWDKPAIREIYQERYHDLARAALRAALTAPA